jgi:hypothetical protein
LFYIGFLSDKNTTILIINFFKSINARIPKNSDIFH